MTYSEDELLEELRRVSEEHCDGEAPRTTDIMNHGNISRPAFYSKYESWEEALDAADFDVSKIKGNLIDKLRIFSENHCNGKAPTWRKFKKDGFCDPETISSKFGGSWNKALKEAGLKVNREKKTEEWTKQEMIEEIQRVSKEKYDGGVPSSTDFTFASNKFGPWKELAEEAGFGEIQEERIHYGDLDEEVLEVINDLEGYPHLYRVSEEMGINHKTIVRNINSENWTEFIKKKSNLREDLLEEIHRLSDDEPPTMKDMEQRGQYDRGTYYTWFGSWGNAVREAGYKDYWNGELVDRYLGSSWNSSKREVLERDSYSCVNCGKSRERLGKNPDIHHIMPVRFWNIEEEHEEMNDPSNLICLCPICHNKYGGMWKECDYEEFKGRLGQESRSIFNY